LNSVIFCFHSWLNIRFLFSIVVVYFLPTGNDEEIKSYFPVLEELC